MATQQDRINGLIGDLGIKAPVLVATTANITLSGTQTIDGVAVVAEDRVLVKNQTDTTQNGVYYCQASTWVRAPDFDGARDCAQGTLIYVVSGTTNGGTLQKLTTTAPVIGTSGLTFSLLGNFTASTFIQTLLDDTTAAAARTTLGSAAVAGSSSQSFSVNNLTAAGNIGAVGLALSGGLSAVGAIIPSQTNGITGTTTNNNANAGAVGEYISSLIPSGSAVSLTNGVGANMTSISLTAGDWDVFGIINFRFGASTSVSSLFGGTNTVSTVLDSYQFSHRCAAFVPGAVDIGYALPVRRYSLSATTTMYAIATAGFTVSTAAAWGFLAARRAR